MTKESNPKINDANRDPITGAPGSHPVGTGVGAALGGAAAGAAIASVAGPVGTVVGAAAGAVVGGLAGKGVAEVVDPTRESAYWESNFSHRPYVEQGASFDDYGPAYRYGIDASLKYDDKEFDDVQNDLSRSWSNVKGRSALAWDRAQHAARDSWDRIRHHN